MREQVKFDLTELLESDDLTPEILAEAAAVVHAAVRRKDNTAVRALGEQLDQRGGSDLMQAVHRQFTGWLRHAARIVDMLWNGIGAWRG